MSPKLKNLQFILELYKKNFLKDFWQQILNYWNKSLHITLKIKHLKITLKNQNKKGKLFQVRSFICIIQSFIHVNRWSIFTPVFQNIEENSRDMKRHAIEQSYWFPLIWYNIITIENIIVRYREQLFQKTFNYSYCFQSNVTLSNQCAILLLFFFFWFWLII